MKTRIHTSLILAAVTQFAAIAAPGDAPSSKSPATAQSPQVTMMKPFVVTAPRITSRDLQLMVVTGSDVHPFRYQAADEALAKRFQTELKADGFKGNVDFLSSTDTPIATLPLLKITLTDWRATPGEPAECDFSATLVTPVGNTSLGNFKGIVSMPRGAPSDHARVDALRQSAIHAIDSVYQDLQAMHAASGNGQ